MISQKLINQLVENKKLNAKDSANILSQLINGNLYGNNIEIAKELAKDHRYLQSELFNLIYWIIQEYSNNYENNCFDGRNEYACKTSNKIVKNVFKQNIN